MLKKSITVLIALISNLAFAGEYSLDISQFQENSLFGHVIVDSAEKVYSDDFLLEDLYKVTYLVNEDCSSSDQSDACAMVPYCEYIWVDMVSTAKGAFFMEGTQKSCDTDIEDILQPKIQDEL